MYERSLLSDAVAAAAIPVERIKGPVLHGGGEDDQVWSGKRFAREPEAWRAGPSC
jgi:hypothetical protein